MGKTYKIGITFGAFEIFHQGHYNILKRASGQCEKLIVGLSTDRYIQSVKGHKPVIPFYLRKEILKALPFVYEVTMQSPMFGKKEAVKLYKPDIIFVGDDWTPATFTGEGLGLPVIYFPRTEGISSSLLAQQ